MIAGIDEAGRGPVIGPMVMAIVAVKDEKELSNLGVKDSKLLSPKARQALYSKIIKSRHEIIVITPQEIDQAVEGDNTNLNWLEAERAAALLNKVKPSKAIIDCPSTNERAYKSYLAKIAPGIELVVEHKADLNHPVVSAASILAKVTRDNIIEELQKEAGDFGSGYPADPKTRAFLIKNHSKFDFFRKSWSTWKNAAGIKNQKNLGEFR